MLMLGERATHERRHTQELEQLRGDPGHLQSLGTEFSCDRHRGSLQRFHRLHGSHPFSPIDEVRKGGDRGHRRFPRRAQIDQSLGFGVGQWGQHDGVDDTEDRRADADAQPGDDDGGQGKARSPCQGSERAQECLSHAVQDSKRRATLREGDPSDSPLFGPRKLSGCGIGASRRRTVILAADLNNARKSQPS